MEYYAMKSHPHLMNLRRSFGSQPVGCVGRLPRPEAGIAARVIPAQSSRWTVRRQGDGFWLLPTCRIWSWMTTGVPTRALCSGHNSGVSCTFNSNLEGSDSICASRTRHAFPGWRSHPNVSSAVTASNRLVAAISLSH